MNFKDKIYAVLGLARSGLATMHILQSDDVKFYAWDDNIKSQKAAKNKGYSLSPIEDWPWEKIDALIISPGIPHTWPKAHPAAIKAKSYNIPIISDIQLFIQRYPNNPIIAITGTNGKSTTTSLIYHIFDSLNSPALIGGNIGKAVNDLNPKKDEAFILELSSYQLEITPKIKPNISALINITADHLERHGGMDNYVKAKSLIFKNQDKNDIAYISIDDLYSYEIYKNILDNNQISLIPISIKTKCKNGVYIEDGWLIDNRNNTTDKVFKLEDANFLNGEHNHQNIAFAYAIATSYGLDKNQVIKAITQYKGLKHRQQYAGKIKNVTFINDSKATNGEAAAKALSSYKNILWLLGGQIKEDGLAKCLHFMDNIEKAFIFGQDKEMLSHMIPTDVKQDTFFDLSSAFASAVQYATIKKSKNFVVLLSPAAASFDQFADFEERGDKFLSLYKDFKEVERDV